jgi:RNA polymerase sigma-70 factor (ECF subfamily)
MAEIPPTRASLLLRLRDPQDEAAWQDFVSLYAPLVYGYARRQGLQDADAADLSQEVLSAVSSAVNHLEYDPRRGSFRNWLFTIVRRKLSNLRRHLRSQPVQGADNQQILEQVADAAELDGAWEAEWRHRLFAWACEQVRREVATETWQAFWKTAIDGQPGSQVAAELGLSLVSVYHARSRVRARLKELVHSAQEQESD